jgi:hypothetical protein
MEGDETMIFLINPKQQGKHRCDTGPPYPCATFCGIVCGDWCKID